MGDLGCGGIQQGGGGGGAPADRALATAIVTGVLTGGEVTINTDPTKYNVAAGTGVIINWVTPSAPVRTEISWDDFIGVVPPDPAKSFTVNGIDINGNLVHGGVGLNESGLLLTNEQERIIISLQVITTLDAVNITGVGTSSRPAYEVIACIIDWVQTHPALISGNKFSTDTATTMSKSSGVTSGLFINRDNNPQNPVPKNNGQIPTVSYSDNFRDGSGGFTVSAPITTVALNLLDDGTGTLATMAPNKYAIRRIFFFGSTEVTAMTYGQVEYNSLAEAKANIFVEDPIIDPRLSLAAFTTALVHKTDADLTDPADAEFIIISAESIGGGAFTIIPPDSVTNIELADMPANTVKVNNTGSIGDPVDLVMAASTILARLASGNIVAATTTQMQTLLNYFADGGEAGGADRSAGNTDLFALSLITNDIARLIISSTGDIQILGNTVIGGILSFDDVNTSIQQAGGSLQIDVATAGTLVFRVENVNEYIFSSLGVDWLGNNISNVAIYESNAVNPATIGAIRLGNSEAISFRNEGNTDNLSISAALFGGYLTITGGNGLNLPDDTSLSWGGGANPPHTILSDSTGMIFTIPNGDQFIWVRSGASNMILGFNQLDIGVRYIEIESLADPGATTGATIGRIFMDSGNSNHLSIRRNGATVDLEVPLIVESTGGMIEAPDDKTYILDQSAAYPYDIDTLIAKTVSGTLSVAIQINGTPVTGINTLAVTSVEATGTATALNVVAIGDVVTMVVTSGSTPIDYSFTLKSTRT